MEGLNLIVIGSGGGTWEGEEGEERKSRIIASKIVISDVIGPAKHRGKNVLNSQWQANSKLLFDINLKVPPSSDCNYDFP